MAYSPFLKGFPCHIDALDQRNGLGNKALWRPVRLIIMIFQQAITLCSTNSKLLYSKQIIDHQAITIKKRLSKFCCLPCPIYNDRTTSTKRLKVCTSYLGFITINICNLKSIFIIQRSLIMRHSHYSDGT